MKKKYACLIVFYVLCLLFSKNSFAKIGVGVNTGKIQVDEKLKAGMMYKLPSVGIINTGDEVSEYQTSIAYQQNQPELKPSEKWFSFNPPKFRLEPGKGQMVEVIINLPLKVEPGNYFAYLEGKPIAMAQKGTTSIGVAAASKLYFTIVPANYLYAIYYKVAGFYETYAPWPKRISIVLAILIVLALFKRFFNIQINVKKNNNPPTDKEDE